MDRSAILDLFDAYADASYNGVYDGQTEAAALSIVSALLPELRGLPPCGALAPRADEYTDVGRLQREVNSLLRHAFCAGVAHGHSLEDLEPPEGANPETIRATYQYNMALACIRNLRSLLVADKETK